jgi:hypothetical protein
VLVHPGGSETSAPNCTTPRTYNLTGDVDGLYTFKVRQTDVAGNTGVFATHSFTLDRVAPVAPSITVQPPPRINDDTPTWGFSGEAGGTYECVLVHPDNSETSAPNCTTPRTYNLTGDVDGLYTFKVRQTDVAGNTGVFATHSFTLDRVAPVAPTITSQPPPRINDDTPTWGFSGEAGGTYECVLVEPDGTEISTAGCATPKSYDLTSEMDGLYTFKVRQTDVAGNTGSFVTVSYTLDRQPPVAPAITGRPANVTANQDPAWTFTGEIGATYECVLVRPDGSEISTSCTSPRSFPLSAEVDGLYTFKVRQTDVAGNTGPYETDDFTLDRVPPTAPTIGDRPVDDVRVDILEWTFGGEPNATFECVLVRPDLSEIVDASCSSPKTIDLGPEPDGDYTFKIRQTDEAGHQSPYITDTFTLDRQAPAAPTITAEPPARTNDATPEWEFTGEPGGSYECVLVRPNSSEIGPVPCTSPKGFALTREQDGLYTFKVRQTDDAGNVGPYATTAFTLDRVRPAAPAVSSLPPNVTANTSPRWTFTWEADATVECVLVRPDGSQMIDAPCSSPKTFSLVAEGDGAYTFKVRQMDVAGNWSGYAIDNFTLDRAAPASLITSEPPPFTNDATVAWDFSGEPGGSYECVLTTPNGVVVSSPVCTSPKSYDLSAREDGLYTFKVRQMDGAFNRGEYTTSSFTLDRQAPVAPTFDLEPPAETNDPSPQWEFSGEGNASYECILMLADGTFADSESCSSPTGFSWSERPDGNYTFKVRQIDAAGNIGPYATDGFRIDRQPPVAPTLTSQPPADTNEATQDWDFAGEAGGSYECVLVKPDGVEVTTSNCSAPVTHDLTGEADGNYTFKVRQTDAVGNVGTYAVAGFALDRVAPAAPTITSTPTNFYDIAAEWSFAGEAGGTYRCVLARADGTEIGSKSCTSPTTFDMTGQSDGDYVFKVSQTDAAGNESVVATDDHYFNKTPPTPLLNGGPPSFTNDPTHESAFTGEPGAVFECTLLGPSGIPMVDSDCSSPYGMDLEDDPDGAYTLSVRQFIGVNGSAAATQTFTLDRAAGSPSLWVTPGPAGSDPSPTWSFRGETGASFECVLVDPDGSEVIQSDCQGPVQRSLSDQPDGDYMVRVRQTDRAGNVSEFRSKNYHLDRAVPLAPRIKSAPKSRTRDLTPRWSFSGENGARFTCTLKAPDGKVVIDRTCMGPKTFKLRRLDGRHVFSVTQRDRAGNESPATVSRFDLDVTKPAAKRLRVGPKTFLPTSQRYINIRFRRSELAVATVKVMKGRKTLKVFKKPLGKTRVALRWRTVYRKKVIEPGRYKVIVKLKDRVGWTSKVAVPLTAQP